MRIFPTRGSGKTIPLPTEIDWEVHFAVNDGSAALAWPDGNGGRRVIVFDIGT